ncbi:MAG: lysylphosphatidylglycerol synthase domain-containing protein [Actinomycetota bacterium]|nr:lysylphosphatidylglycerol synthase domain-containing protein [Actinomycetota bacterium]
MAGVSLAVWLSEAFVFWLIARSLELEVSIPEASLVVVLGSLFALVPAAPGYVGTYDAALLFTLHALGIGGGSALGAVLLFRFVVFVPITVAGLVLMVVLYGGLRALSDAERGSSASDALTANGAGAVAEGRPVAGSRRG